MKTFRGIRDLITQYRNTARTLRQALEARRGPRQPSPFEAEVELLRGMLRDVLWTLKLLVGRPVLRRGEQERRKSQVQIGWRGPAPELEACAHLQTFRRLARGLADQLAQYTTRDAAQRSVLAHVERHLPSEDFLILRWVLLGHELDDIARWLKLPRKQAYRRVEQVFKAACGLLDPRERKSHAAREQRQRQQQHG